MEHAPIYTAKMNKFNKVLHFYLPLFIPYFSSNKHFYHRKNNRKTFSGVIERPYSLSKLINIGTFNEI